MKCMIPLLAVALIIGAVALHEPAQATISSPALATGITFDELPLRDSFSVSTPVSTLPLLPWHDPLYNPASQPLPTHSVTNPGDKGIVITSIQRSATGRCFLHVDGNHFLTIQRSSLTGPADPFNAPVLVMPGSTWVIRIYENALGGVSGDLTIQGYLVNVSEI